MSGNTDNVNSPKHYIECSIECIDAMSIAFGDDAVYDFCKLNAFKYLWRHRHKNNMEDLDKGIWYCNKAQSIYKNTYGYESDEITRILTVIKKYADKYFTES